jgi:alanine racemase
VKIGDEVVVIGQQDEESILISEIAKMTNKISYELMCSISKRVPRIYA